jgi:hypothetical protein
MQSTPRLPKRYSDWLKVDPPTLLSMCGNLACKRRQKRRPLTCHPAHSWNWARGLDWFPWQLPWEVATVIATDYEILALELTDYAAQTFRNLEISTRHHEDQRHYVYGCVSK